MNFGEKVLGIRESAIKQQTDRTQQEDAKLQIWAVEHLKQAKKELLEIASNPNAKLEVTLNETRNGNVARFLPSLCEPEGIDFSSSEDVMVTYLNFKVKQKTR